jgi:hypothetical protein
MKHLDEKYFVPFPSFFKGKDYGIETFIGIDVFCDNLPRSFNIIFTKSDQLEEIKKEAAYDWGVVQNLTLSEHIKLAVFKIHEKVNGEEPSKPRFKLEFKNGSEDWDFSEETETIIISIPGQDLPDISKIFFYPSGTFDEIDRMKIKV